MNAIMDLKIENTHFFSCSIPSLNILSVVFLIVTPLTTNQKTLGEGTGLKNHTTLVEISTLPAILCKMLDNLLNFFAP